MRRIAWGVGVCALLLGCRESPDHRDQADTRPSFPTIGSTPPRIALPPFDSTKSGLVLDEERGHVVVLAYWATWCGPCVEEMPELSRLAERYRDQGLRVYAVIHDDDPATAAKWMRAHGVELPLLLDPGKHAWQAYQARGLPTAYVIARDGTLWHRQEGYEGPGHWEPRLQAALAGRPSA